MSKTLLYLIFSFTTALCAAIPSFTEQRVSNDGTEAFFYINESYAITRHRIQSSGGTTERYHYSLVKAHFLNKPELIYMTGDTVDEEVINNLQFAGTVTSGAKQVFFIFYGLQAKVNFEKIDELGFPEVESKYVYVLIDEKNTCRQFTDLSQIADEFNSMRIDGIKLTLHTPDKYIELQPSKLLR